MPQFALKLRKLREEAGLSREAFTKKTGVSLSFVYNLETGKYSTFSIDTSRRLAKGLGLTLRGFLEAIGLL